MHRNLLVLLFHFQHLFEENIDNYSYSNVLFDFGSNYETGFRDLNIAFVFQHIGPDVTPIDTKFRSPLMFRIGMSD